jgi:hypothetical protein
LRRNHINGNGRRGRFATDENLLAMRKEMVRIEGMPPRLPQKAPRALALDSKRMDRLTQKFGEHFGRIGIAY